MRAGLYAHEAITLIDPRFRIRLMNPAAEIFFGEKHERVVGRTIEEAFPWLWQSAKIRAGLRQTLKKGQFADEVAILRMGAKEVAVEIVRMPWKRDGAIDVGIVIWRLLGSW